MHKVSRSKWARTHRDSKTTGANPVPRPDLPGGGWPKGQRGILMWTDKGTALVPVELVTCPVCDNAYKPTKAMPGATCSDCDLVIGKA